MSADRDQKHLVAWSDDTALRGQEAPKWDGHIEHLIQYLLTVHKRFGNTCITADLQWGATAMWKRDEKQERIVELEGELLALRTEVEARKANPAFLDTRGKTVMLDSDYDALRKDAERYRYWRDLVVRDMTIALSAADADIYVAIVDSKTHTGIDCLLDAALARQAGGPT